MVDVICIISIILWIIVEVGYALYKHATLTWYNEERCKCDSPQDFRWAVNPLCNSLIKWLDECVYIDPLLMAISHFITGFIPLFIGCLALDLLVCDPITFFTLFGIICIILGLIGGFLLTRSYYKKIYELEKMKEGGN